MYLYFAYLSKILSYTSNVFVQVYIIILVSNDFWQAGKLASQLKNNYKRGTVKSAIIID